MNTPRKVYIKPHPRVLAGTLLAALIVYPILGARWTASHPSPNQVRSLAVLPLENLSMAPDQEYLADGMTDELIASLARIRRLRVIPRTTSMAYKGSHKSLSDGVVEGMGMFSVMVWHVINASDAAIRSGLSGYTQWIAYQWDASVLKPAGQDNVLTFSVSQPQGALYDALRMELTNTSADPAIRGWKDYEYIYKTTDTKANDAVPNP